MFSSWTTSAKATWSRWGALSGLGKSPWTPSTPQVRGQWWAGLLCVRRLQGGYSFDPAFPPCQAWLLCMKPSCLETWNV